MYCMLCSVVLEVYQFARDAAVAEAWLMAHEPYLSSQEYGVCSCLDSCQEQLTDTPERSC